MPEDPRLDPDYWYHYEDEPRYERVQDVPERVVQEWIEKNLHRIMDLYEDEILDYANEMEE